MSNLLSCMRILCIIYIFILYCVFRWLIIQGILYSIKYKGAIIDDIEDLWSIIPSTWHQILHPALFGCHFMALPWKSLHSGVQGKLQAVKVIPHSLTSYNHKLWPPQTRMQTFMVTYGPPSVAGEKQSLWQNMMRSTIAMTDHLLSIGILSICEHCWSPEVWATYMSLFPLKFQCALPHSNLHFFRRCGVPKRNRTWKVC